MENQTPQQGLDPTSELAWRRRRRFWQRPAALVPVGLVSLLLMYSHSPIFLYLVMDPMDVPDWLETFLEVFWTPLIFLYENVSLVEAYYDFWFDWLGVH